MRYQIRHTDRGLLVEVRDLADDEERLVDAIGACREGRCDCPSEEYLKLGRVDVERRPEGLRIRLEARPGMRLDETQVDRCLAHSRAAFESADDGSD